jgi:putative membrane protein
MVLALGAILVVPLLPLAPIAMHMAHHIAVMNVAAPLFAVALLRPQRPTWAAGGAWLWLVTVLQMLLLWGWHAPQAHAAAAGSIPMHVAMVTSLFVTSLGFWLAVLQRASRSNWQAVLALLVTGKLACLLGALLVFSPRQLYAGAGALHSSLDAAAGGLDDQQLAGLLMLTACSLSYVLAGVVIAARIVNRATNAVTVPGAAPVAVGP